MFPWLYILYLTTILLLPSLPLSSPFFLPSVPPFSLPHLSSLPLPSTLTVPSLPFPPSPSLSLPLPSPSPSPLPSLYCRVCQLVPADGKPLPLSTPPLPSLPPTPTTCHSCVNTPTAPHKVNRLDVLCFYCINERTVCESMCACIQAWHSCMCSRNWQQVQVMVPSTDSILSKWSWKDMNESFTPYLSDISTT